MIYHVSWYIVIHRNSCPCYLFACDQRLVGLWIKLYCNCCLCDTGIIFSGSQLLASIALKSVISCAGNVFYSVLSCHSCFYVFHLICMGLGTTCVSMIWRSLSLMRLHSFTISQIVSSKFAASKDFKGYVLWCFARRQLAWWNCIRPMSWCHVVSRSKQSKKNIKKKWFRDVSSAFVNNGCHFGLRIHRIQMM